MKRDLIKVPNNIKMVPAEDICLKETKKTEKKQLCERKEVIAWKVE
jgi:hypothetical protein